jgi:hypothetical protein
VGAPVRFLPHADAEVVEQVVVAADTARTYGAIGSTDVSSDRIVSLFGALDDARTRLAGEEPAARTLDRLLAANAGPVELAAEPGARRVIGVVGRYNGLERSVAHLRADQFDAFDEPGHLKAAVEFRVRRQDERQSLLGCEVRVQATDEDLRATLGMTWFVVGRGVRLGVRRLLTAIRTEAERSGPETAENGDSDRDHGDAGDLDPA